MSRSIGILARSTERLIFKALLRLDYVADVSPKAVQNVAKYLMRDLERISNKQGNSISATKYAGYWMFWIRKLKPISMCHPSGADPDDPANEIDNINELIAIEVGLSILKRDGKGLGESDIYDPVRRNCKKDDCDGKECVQFYASNYFSFNDEAHKKYLIYSMRHRTFGPHHACILFENMVFGGCSDAREGRIRSIEADASL